ncbi:uncharacterized protein LOC131456848 [Solea solea]|uniref:uncharacterized protein LOC131456848 n=1 Tax=Solea solea TaxID=90069 RepID=UPI00272AD9C5|nr:uncharacterized protein LOC131456848 [Solea solea]
MMTSPNFVFLVAYLLFGKLAETNHLVLSTTAHQDIGFISANVGDNVTLSCLFTRDDDELYWYKQTLGQKPQLICFVKRLDASVRTDSYCNNVRKNPRVSLQTDAGLNHLNISDVQLSDSATYFCVSFRSVWSEFKEVITVSVEGSRWNLHPLVHQSESQRLQPGDSVTLNCTVHTGACAGEEHSVYWLKNSQEPHHGTIYTKGDRSDQCERKPNTQTHTCVYKLPMNSVNLSHAGTYYCAVATCGHILFGNGTNLDFNDQSSMYIMAGALTFTTLLSILLAFLLYKRDKCSESCAQLSARATTNEEGNRDGDNVHYAALSVHLPNRSRRQMDNANNECVYSSVRH